MDLKIFFSYVRSNKNVESCSTNRIYYQVNENYFGYSLLKTEIYLLLGYCLKAVESREFEE